MDKSSPATDKSATCGIFIGGAARRLSGVCKGLLPAPDGSGPLVLRLANLARGLGLLPVLVGQRPEYAFLGLPMIADAVVDPVANPVANPVAEAGAETPAVGPLGGLLALLEYADGGPCIALAGDLPYLTAPLLGRLWAEVRGTEAIAGERRDVVAARRGSTAPWEPLFAGYLPSTRPSLRAAIAEGARSFQALFRRLRVAELALSADEHRLLDDWDTPLDVAATAHRRKPR